MERTLRKYLGKGQFAGTPEMRSRAMAAVRGRGNKTTEATLRLALVRASMRGWRVNDSTLPGCPDFVFPAERVAVFVDGCFWHGCSECGHIPKTNRQFWQAKIRRNRERDECSSRRLRQQKFTVLRFWEHELRSALPSCVVRIQHAMKTRGRPKRLGPPAHARSRRARAASGSSPSTRRSKICRGE